MNVLSACSHYDFYCLPGYHRLAELRGEGAATLFAYTEDEYTIALPLLIRPLDNVPGLEAVGKGWRDATSVYGYAGPIASHKVIPPQIMVNYRHAIHEYLCEQNVVTLFTRCNPLLEQEYLIDNLGEQVLVGLTVSIAPTAVESDLLLQYRPNHRRHINRLRRSGAVCIWDSAGEHLERFASIYHETMDRVHAADMYYFDEEYFRQLWELNPDSVHVCMLHFDQRLVCGAVFTLSGGIVQYHLGATLNDYLKHSPLKLVLHEAALWAARNGAHVLHLGGGVGAREDALFHFKAGFSSRRHEYRVWRWIVQPDIYRQLCHIRQETSHPFDENFFPPYRTP